jgi:branched-chain amino acid transport system permease protein
MPDLLPFVISGLGVARSMRYRALGSSCCTVRRRDFAFGALGAVALASPGQHWITNGRWRLPRWLQSRFRSGFRLPALARPACRIGNRQYAQSARWAARVAGFHQWFWGEQPRRLVLPTDAGAIEFADVRLTYTRVLGLAAAVTMMAAVGLLLARTRIGLAMRALADQRGLSAILGIRVLRVDTTAWVISGAFAGVCGILLGNIVRLQATVLTFLVIPAFAAAIIGRLSSLPATVAGGMAIGMLEALAVLLPGFAPFRTATPFLIALLAIVSWRDTSRKA